VLAVRSDNGGEFISRDFDALLTERGSSRERTAAHTPQQNGVAERINRTLLNSIRAMLHDGQLDDSFWDEALRTAVNIHNRVPTRALNGKTPHEAWTGNKPRVGHMRVFGSLAYAHLPEQGRNKLALRARKCVFVGYAQDAKAYRLWDTKAKKIVVSRDVDFWEGVSWTSEAAGRGGAVPVAPGTKLTGPSRMWQLVVLPILDYARGSVRHCRRQQRRSYCMPCLGTAIEALRGELGWRRGTRRDGSLV
jgi:hypothetical protein